MSFYIYGLRLVGERECRYVGMTSHNAQSRLRKLAEDARAGRNSGGLRDWLLENDGQIEAFHIAKVDTRSEAHATERAIVALLLRLDHRLLNFWLVPPESRIGWKPTLAQQRAQARKRLTA